MIDDSPLLEAEILVEHHRDGRVVALVAFERIGPDHVCILRVAVHKEHRRQGIASRLLREVVGYAAVTSLAVAVDNGPAIRLYKTLGFTAQDEQRHRGYVVMSYQRPSSST
jgi:ribosomal protein S18 acetylase RimI-like enzyme